MNKSVIGFAFISAVAVGAPEVFNASYGKYQPGGEGTPPKFEFSYNFAYMNETYTEKIDPVKQGCHYLNGGFRPKDGPSTWRECTHVRSLELPRTFKDYSGTKPYMHYSPPRLGVEKYVFILLFGDQEIEVTCVLNTVPYEH